MKNQLLQTGGLSHAVRSHIDEMGVGERLTFQNFMYSEAEIIGYLRILFPSRTFSLGATIYEGANTLRHLVRVK